jgi:hypothetical protein
MTSRLGYPWLSYSILLTLVQVCCGQSARVGSSQITVSLPPVMRFCATFCFTLHLKDGHYDAIQDGDSKQAIVSTYTVVRFTPEAVEINRADKGGARAVLAGKISPDGNSVSSGIMKWANGGSGTYHLTWGNALMSATKTTQPANAPESGSGEQEYKTGSWLGDQMLDAMNQARANAPPPDIFLPPGADPSYTKLASDIRAVWRQEGGLNPEDAYLPCNLAESFGGPKTMDSATLANVELEIGKFAYRAADFPRGYCWIKRSADLGNLRAEVLLGLAYGKGWGVPKDLDKAFKYFSDTGATGKDPWGVYFLEICYKIGAGTPVDNNKATNLDHWMMFHDQGRDVIFSIGADNADLVRSFKRGMVELWPPVHEVEHPCYTKYCGPAKTWEVDQEALNDELNRLATPPSHPQWPTPRAKGDPVALPAVMRACLVGNCFTLKLNSGAYDASVDGSQNPAAPSLFHVQQFTTKSVVLRVGIPGPRMGIMAGDVAEDGNHLERCSIESTYFPNGAITCQLSWGAALSTATIVGTSQPAPSIDPDYVSCGRSDTNGTTADLAYDGSVASLRTRNFGLRKCWLQMSAALGNSHAATVLAGEAQMSPSPQ